jgi:hypothetical protein
LLQGFHPVHCSFWIIASRALRSIPDRLIDWIHKAQWPGSNTNLWTAAFSTLASLNGIEKLFPVYHASN